MIRHAVGIEHVTDAGGVALGLSRLLPQIGLIVRRAETWVVKLNLTYPQYLPGVVNSPVFTEGMCRWASDSGIKLIFIEGDGGNGAYSAQDTFDANQVTAIATRYGMSVASVSEKPWEIRETIVAGRPVRLPYSPFFRRHQYDRLVTAPLFKNHVYTLVTLGMKNLWGCIPDAYRMYYHHLLDRGIVALVKELEPDLSIFDGLVGLRGRGPMDGRPVAMNTLMVAANVGAGEVAALRVMGLPLERVRHLSIAKSEGLVPDADALEWTTDPTRFVRDDFIMNRSFLDRASITLGRFPKLQRLTYHSPMSRMIYPIVNRFRQGSAQARLVEAKKQHAYKTIRLQDR